MKKTCIHCGIEFTKSKFRSLNSWKTAQFCSKKCAATHKGELLSSSIEKECKECGNLFTVQQYRKDTAKFCSKECFHQNRDFGLTTEHYRIRRGAEFRRWRELVFERDNYTCQKCLHRGDYLHPHHIENFAENKAIRFNIDNGITLCSDCHIEFHTTYGFTNNNSLQLEEFLAVGEEV